VQRDWTGDRGKKSEKGQPRGEGGDGQRFVSTVEDGGKKPGLQGSAEEEERLKTLTQTARGEENSGKWTV